MPEPRIYYQEEKLYGAPVASQVIMLDIFNFILNNVSYQQYKTGEPLGADVKDTDFAPPASARFKFSFIRNDGFVYQSKDEGNFYLPQAIIMFDESDYGSSPIDFYFIARIKDALELGHFQDSKEGQWFQIPGRITSLSDPAIIKRMESTLEELLRQVEAEKQAKAEKAAKKAARPPASQGKRAAYASLTKLCLPQSPRQAEVLALIDDLKEYDSTYDDFRMHMNHNDIPFIITLDWKEAVGELEAWASHAARENFGREFRFEPGEYDDESSVGDDGLFE